MQDVTNITCQHIYIYGLFLMFKLILQNSKVPLGGLSQLYIVIIEYSPTFSYHLRKLDYASVTPDHTKNSKTVSSTPLRSYSETNLKTLIKKGAKFMKKLGILGGILQN